MIPKYKDIVDLLKKGSTLEAQEKIMELREAVLELQEENSELKHKLSDAEVQLTFNKSLHFESPFYYSGDDPVPFCPKCWEADKKAIHLPPPHHVTSGPRYDCVECKSIFIHPKNR